MYCEKCLDKAYKHSEKERKLIKQARDNLLLMENIFDRELKLIIKKEKIGVDRNVLRKALEEVKKLWKY